MLNRQRLLLALIDEAAGTVGSLTLVKLAFLVREHGIVGRDSTFYRFVPYRYGPFSFALYRELAALERDGYVKRAGDTLATSPLARPEIARLSSAMRAAARDTAEEYGSLTVNALLRSVYRRYPWYATRSERRDLAPADLPAPPRPKPAIFTVGYEGKSVDELFDGLLASGMAGIVDVRANPVSRKYGLAKRSMSQIAENLGLVYYHMPELGIAGEYRRSLSDFASYQRLLDRYERAMLPLRVREVQALGEQLASRPLVLLCVERDVNCCHRGRLAKRLSEEVELPIVHL